MNVSVKWLIAGCVLALLLIAVISVMVGRYPVGWSDLFHIMTGVTGRRTAEVLQVIVDIRLPRLLGALLVGCALSAAGTVYQVMFRNPLVSPDILGVSAGASLGAVLAIYMKWPVVLIEICAFAGGLLAVMVVYLLSIRLRRLDHTLVLILTGVVVSSVFGSLISLLKILADPFTQLSTITFWLMGGLNTIQYAELKYTLPCVMVALLPIILLRWRVNLLNLSDDESTAIGINPHHLRLILIMAATLMTSCVVAISGTIGWVGLIIPHIARILVGARFTLVLLLSLLLGPAFLLLADTAARMVAPMDLPLSILTSFIGAPFFIFLLIRKNGKG